MWRKAVLLVQNGTLGRACGTVEKVLPLHKLNHYVPYNL